MQTNRGNIVAALLLVFAVVILAVGFFLANQKFGSFNLGRKAAGSGSILTLTPSEISTTVGSKSNVVVTMISQENFVSAVDLVVNFDPTFLVIDEITPASYFPSPITLSPFKIAGGKAGFIFGNTPSTNVHGIKSSSPLVNIKFHSLKIGSTKISLEGTQVAAVGKIGNVFESGGDSQISITPNTPKASWLVKQSLLNNNPRTVEFITQYYDQNGTDKIGNVQLVIRNNPNWLVLPYYFQGMYSQNYTTGTTNFPVGAYVYDVNTTALRFGWGNPVAVGQTKGNTYADFKVTEVKNIDSKTLKVTWQVNFKSTYAPGQYNVYLWQADKSGNQDSYTQPQEVVTNYNANFYFVKVSSVTLP